MVSSNPISIHRPAGHERWLWFGVTGAAIAWIVAEFLNVLIFGQSCPRWAAAWVQPAPLAPRIILLVITLALLAMAIAAGLVCHRLWRRLNAENTSFLKAEGYDRRTYMTLFGWVVSSTLGLGLIWFALPICIIRLCVRAH